jgi:hypothetical protein
MKPYIKNKFNIEINVPFLAYDTNLFVMLYSNGYIYLLHYFKLSQSPCCLSQKENIFTMLSMCSHRQNIKRAMKHDESLNLDIVPSQIESMAAIYDVLRQTKLS